MGASSDFQHGSCRAGHLPRQRIALCVAQVQTILDPLQPALEAVDAPGLACNVTVEVRRVKRPLMSRTSARSSPISMRRARKYSRTRVLDSLAMTSVWYACV